MIVILYFTTLFHSTPVPTSVVKLQAEAINSTAISITWQPPINPNGNVTYQVMVSSDPLYTTETVATSLIVANLNVYTIYYVNVTARNTAGVSHPEDTNVTTGESGMYCMYVHMSTIQ